MAINWKAHKPNVSRHNDYKLFGAVMGVSGSGKSTSCGTLPGKILWLYSESFESHGPTYALNKVSGDTEITAINLDVDMNDPEKELSYDGRLDQLRAILNDDGTAKAFDSLVIDGLTTIEYIYTNSKECKTQAVTSSGKKDQWAVFRLTTEFFNELFISLNTLNRNGLNVISTCLGSHVAHDDDTTVFKPKLQGVGVAEAFLAKLPDRILAVRSQGGQFKFKFNETIEKANDRRQVDCSPRLMPLGSHEVPSEMTPDFRKILMLKNGEAVLDQTSGKVELTKKKLESVK